jgi:hypothetical protein
MHISVANLLWSQFYEQLSVDYFIQIQIGYFVRIQIDYSIEIQIDHFMQIQNRFWGRRSYWIKQIIASLTTQKQFELRFHSRRVNFVKFSKKMISFLDNTNTHSSEGPNIISSALLSDH